MTVTMTRAIRISEVGPVDGLTWETIPLPPPGPGEVRIRHTAIGVNYVDIYHRTGLYPLPSLPGVLGVEAAGVVEGMGTGVEGLEIGQRVVWAGIPGAYCEARNIDARRLVPVPDDVDDATLAAGFLRGLTAHMVIETVRPLHRGEVVLVHAAAGGLGGLLAQWASARGAVVIGTVGHPDKVPQAKVAGVDHVVLYRETDFVAAVRDLTAGKGAHVVYDGIGGDTLLRSLDATRPFGMVVSVGQAGGAIAPLAVTELGPRRSLALARPSVFAYTADPAFFIPAAAAVLASMGAGMTVPVSQTFPLSQAAAAHRLLEAGQSSGAMLLSP